MAFTGDMREEMGHITEVWFLGTNVAVQWYIVGRHCSTAFEGAEVN